MYLNRFVREFFNYIQKTALIQPPLKYKQKE